MIRDLLDLGTGQFTEVGMLEDQSLVDNRLDAVGVPCMTPVVVQKIGVRISHALDRAPRAIDTMTLTIETVEAS